MKKIFKITIILMIIMLGFGQISYVNADDLTKKADSGAHEGNPPQSIVRNWSGQTDDYWDPSGEETDTKELDDIAKVIVTIIRSVGIIVSVIVLMVIGIKEMTASIEEKSIIKQAMPGYILGAIMVMAITWLPSLIYDIVKG